MSHTLSHRRAVLLMIVAPTLWSSAGVLTRHLDTAHGFEVTFWRSMFAALFVAGALLRQGPGVALRRIAGLGTIGMVSGVMWAIMFCCFMIAMTMTTVANTLIVMSISPLLTAFLAWIFLHQRIAVRTMMAIAVAFLGMVWMFAHGVSQVGGVQLLGMLIALGVPLAASINVIVMKQAGARVDLIPAVLVGGVVSALCMLPWMFSSAVSLHDLLILATLGFFQLGLPCMLMVRAARGLSAPELSLLALIEVLLGPIWAWLWAGEVPAGATLAGGALVLTALVFNELVALRETGAQADIVSSSGTLS